MLHSTCHRGALLAISSRALKFLWTCQLLGCGVVGFILSAQWLHAAQDDKPLDFSFTLDVPGEKVLIDNFRLHVYCIGTGNTTVLFEAGLGGSSLEWVPVQTQVSKSARACIYDRAGYAWSDPSGLPSHAQELSREADILLDRIGADGPLLLVGHSFGGYVIRELARRRKAEMIGMVLVDASHEDQLVRLENITGRSMMPRGNSFVVSKVQIPDSLPEEIRRKIKAFSNMRKTYAALHSEMRFFRESAMQVKLNRSIVDYPVTVISRGNDLYAEDSLGRQKTVIWEELQADLTELSTVSSWIIAQDSGHHVHTDDPDIVINAIVDILSSEASDQPGKQ